MFLHLRNDFQSSMVTFLVALPLCLGIALASQAPLASGLIAGIIGGLLVSLLSNSELSVSGPAAGLAVIVAVSIQQLGDFSTFTAAVMLSGLIQLIFAAIRGGRLGSYFPTSVIQGMLSAIGLLLILKQIPHALGYDASYMGSEEFHQHEGGNTFGGIFGAFNAIQLSCALIAMISFMIITSWDRFSRRSKNGLLKAVPSALLAVLASVFVSEFLFQSVSLRIEERHLVQLPFSGGWHNFVAGLSLPNWAAFGDLRIYSIALTIAVVGSLESLLSLDAADKIDPEKRVSSKNRELFAQGMGNTLSGLVGGLPITAVIVRTSANVQAGAKSKTSAFLHGAWLLLSVLLIPSLLNRIPLATLAMILILVGYKLTKPELYVKMYQKGLDQFIPFVVTIVAILLTDLLKGILIGMVVGFFFVFKKNHHQSIIMVNDEKDYLIRFMKDASFLQKDRLIQILHSVPPHSRVIIDGSKDVFIDTDIINLVEDFIEGSKQKNISVELKKSSTALSRFFTVA
jgi:MFS superfamily sulfate permease-like transporter